MSRFTTKYYSSYHRVNGMIGFVVEEMDIHLNTAKINKLLKTLGSPITNKYITKDNFIEKFEHQHPSVYLDKDIDKFEYQYHSTQLDKDGEELKIYHLMFEFSENIL